MRWEFLASSLALALIFLPLLAWRWHLKMGTVVPSAIVIGGLTGFIVSRIATLPAEFNMATLVLIEFFLVLLIPFLIVIIRFYRDPERSPLETERVILSPADGKIVYVNKVEKGSALVATKGQRKFSLDEITNTDLLTDAAYLVGIDMNLFNVHVNRSPIRGQLIFQKHINGKFISLRKQEANMVNERITTVIDNGRFRIGVIQIASRLVRRIVSYVKEGDNLEIGQRIGIIKFGSQVDVVIPALEALKIEVKPGDEVIAGISVVARYD